MSGPTVVEESEEIGVKKTATFGPEKNEQGDYIYRYRLTRTWPGGKGSCVFLMLNPSTADHKVDDPTVRRCMIWTQKWGYKVLVVVNIFAYRSTSPKVLPNVKDPIGKDNDEFISQAVHFADRVVAAWGNHGTILKRGAKLLPMLTKARCFGFTKDSQPKHPLYIPGGQPLIPLIQ